jgi:hypothetical protein
MRARKHPRPPAVQEVQLQKRTDKVPLTVRGAPTCSVLLFTDCGSVAMKPLVPTEE